MELVGILRLLSRRPILLAIGAVAAIAIGILAAGRGETKTTGSASARLIVDTAKSQLTYQAPGAVDTLPWRTSLLAYLAGSRSLTDRIATEVGIRRSELAVLYPDLEVPEKPDSLPSRASEVAAVISEKYVLTVDYDELLPVISLGAEAPDRGAASRLVEAAIGALKDAGTPASVTPQIQGLAVDSIGPVRSKAVVHKLPPLLGVGIAIVLFGIWSAAVAFIPLLLSAWRDAGRRAQPA
jgi:hypothetical protein